MCGIFMNIPKDVTLGLPYLSIIGNVEVHIDNHKGILEYNSTIVRVQTKVGKINISGTKLDIDYYANDELKICGKILKIEFQFGGTNC